MKFFDKSKSKKKAERVSVVRGDLFDRMSNEEMADLPPFHPRERN